MVGCRSVAFVGVYARHKVCLHILWQLLRDVNALVVLSLRIHNVDGLVFAYQDSLVANLSTHLAIEWRMVQHQFKESILLLGNLSVTQNVAFVFGVVVADKLLFALAQYHPVAVFHSCSIAGTCLLLCHFFLELPFVYTEAVFATNQFSQIEWETVGIEQAERLFPAEFGLSLRFHFVHCVG